MHAASFQAPPFSCSSGVLETPTGLPLPIANRAFPFFQLLIECKYSNRYRATYEKANRSKRQLRTMDWSGSFFVLASNLMVCLTCICQISTISSMFYALSELRRIVMPVSLASIYRSDWSTLCPSGPASRAALLAKGTGYHPAKRYT